VEIIKRTGKPVVVEHIHYDRYGDLRNVEVHGYPIFDEAGRVSQVIEYSLDITDRKRAERELQEKEEYLRTMMATIQTGVMISELVSGRITDVNPFAARLIGEDANSLIGQPWTHCLEEASDQDEVGQNGREGEDGRLHTAQGKALSVRLSKAEVCIREQCYTIHSFLDISDMQGSFSGRRSTSNWRRACSPWSIPGSRGITPSMSGWDCISRPYPCRVGRPGAITSSFATCPRTATGPGPPPT
jgi:PAS domain S-box-containing protein